ARPSTCCSGAREAPFRIPSWCAAAGMGRSCTPIQRWLSTPTPARSSGTTSSCPATTGISIMCSSRFSWTSTWEIGRGRRCWQSESPASSGRSTGAQANSCGRRETTHQTVFESIDPETGKVTINESLIPKELEQNQVVCPSFYGGKLWMATAYNPASKTLFLPLNNLCMDYKAVEQKPLVG